MRINEDNLAEELKKRNLLALEFLVERYGNLILKVAYSVLNDRETSMECMNDVLLRVWDNIESFKGEESKFTTWLIVITKRIAIDELRKKANKQNNIPLEEFIISDESDLQKQLESNITREKILKEINSMEEINKQIFIRRFFMGESIKDISSKLGISKSAVANRILRGKSKLEYLFKEEVI